MNYYDLITHLIGKLTNNYYFEDYVRVYPNGIIFNRWGLRKKFTDDNYKNYLNHTKFYKFTCQFVKNKNVIDLGCGSGYGCKILKNSDAKYILGIDISKKAIKFAKKYYNQYADFKILGLTNMEDLKDNSFEVSICSEVLEHLKEYNMVNIALKEIKRITKRKGLIIFSTPNIELLSHHGFSFEEINNLFSNKFKKFCIFENSLVPFDQNKKKWEKRLSKGDVGIIISEKINLNETVLPNKDVEFKKGLNVKKYEFYDYLIDTTFFHNTHSWIIIAINDK
ncbi:MAG: class I SAM-dependent methyltransferase [Promethearchaeota archaeon]